MSIAALVQVAWTQVAAAHLPAVTTRTCHVSDSREEVEAENETCHQAAEHMTADLQLVEEAMSQIASMTETILSIEDAHMRVVVATKESPSILTFAAVVVVVELEAIHAIPVTTNQVNSRMTHPSDPESRMADHTEIQRVLTEVAVEVRESPLLVKHHSSRYYTCIPNLFV